MVHEPLEAHSGAAQLGMRPGSLFIVALVGFLGLGVPTGAPRCDEFGSESSTPPPALSESATREMQAAVEQIMHSHGFPGIAIGVVRNDRLVHAAGFGVRDLDSNEPVTPHTLFQIGSVSKTLTTTLLGELVEDGRLDLDAPVTAYLLDDVRLPASVHPEGITARQLASHMSGLPSVPQLANRTIDTELIEGFTRAELLESLARAEPVAAPGERFEYSALGYGLLGLILAEAAGQPFETLMNDRVFEPLGMAETRLDPEPANETLMATPYHIEKDGTSPERTRIARMEELAPAGGVTSNVVDLARFASAHVLAEGNTPPMISSQTRDLLYEVQWRFSDQLAYALGWGTARVKGIDYPVVFHDGRVAGYTAYLGLVPADGVAVIVLTNLGGDPTPAPIRTLGNWLLARAVADLRRG